MQELSPSARKPVSDSLFNMWRCAIVMAHADGVIHESEREFFDRVFKSMERVYALTEAHLKVFADDLKSPQDVDGLLPRVTDAECKILLLHFCQIVAWVDGNLSPQELALLKKLHTNCNQDPGTAERVAQIREDIAEQIFRLKTEAEDRQGTRDPLFYAISALLQRLGVDMPADAA